MAKIRVAAIDDGEDGLLDKILEEDNPFDCFLCKNLIEGTLTCRAFPEGILDAILHNELIHDVPIEGDNGIQWERR